MTMTPSEVGARAELAVAAALATAGKLVYVPLFNAHGRTDLLYEDDTGFHRVQCKTGRVKGQVVGFRTCSNTKNIPRDYVGQIDEFGVYAPELSQVFLVPIDDVASRYCFLRLEPAANGQAKGVHWAKDYLLG